VFEPEADERDRPAVRPAADTARDVLGAPLSTVALELAVRAALVLLSVRWLPDIFTGDLRHFYRAANRMSTDSLPYRDVLWEFPPFTLVPLLVAEGVSNLASTAVTSFRLFQITFVTIMVAAEYGSLLVLRRAHPHLASRLTVAWSMVVLPLATVAWFRWDFLSVFFATVAFNAVVRGRSSAPWVFAGFVTRLWPAVLVVTQYVGRRRRDLVRTLVLCAGGTALWWLFSPGGFQRFLEFRRGSGLQIESAMASVVRPFVGGRTDTVSGTVVIGRGGWAWVEPLLLAVLLAIVVAVAWVSVRRPTNLVAATGLVVTATMLCSRILSPQYLVWVAPFVVLLHARGHRRPANLMAGAGLLTVAFLYHYAELVDAGSGAESGLWHLVLFGRNALLVWLVVELVRLAWPPVAEPAAVVPDAAADHPPGAAG
jgi:hypothetical protein